MAPPRPSIVDWGREICGTLATAESREWLCTNGIGGFASGTVAGMLTRRYHGLLMAALKPPLGRTLLVAKVDDTVEYDGLARPLFATHWGNGSVDPHGYRDIERFRLEGTTPVWTFAVADALLEKRVWMEQGANTTYVAYRLLRGVHPVALSLKALVNYRDYHATTHAGDWRMRIEGGADGLRITAFDGARPFVVRARGARVEPGHVWYHGFAVAREWDRGLEGEEDHLYAGAFGVTLTPGAAFTLVLSAETEPDLDGEAAWQRRQAHEDAVTGAWRAVWPSAETEPEWVRHLPLAADQFIVRRPLQQDPDAMSVIAGYHWFGDWGRDTMISLPGLTIATGRYDIGKRILTTFARFVDRGMLPNWFPDRGEEPEYNTVDATLWYFQAVRALHAATRDDGLLKDLFPVLEDIVRWHRQGTRFGIVEDPADGLLRAGEAGVQLTWMDARVGDRVITPRMGKPVEINALWFTALRAMAGFAKRLGMAAEPWDAAADRAAAAFDRFWNARTGYCYDVIDGPGGDDDSLRPNQIFAVSLPDSPLSPERQRAVVDACGRHLLTSYGLRSLAPGHPQYCPTCSGSPGDRDGAYHQGTVWGWLAGPFALAHLRAYGDPAAARALLEPMKHHLADFGVGSIAEIFDGDPPFLPRGCVAQAWSVSETLRAWMEIGRASAEPAAARRGKARK